MKARTALEFLKDGIGTIDHEDPYWLAEAEEAIATLRRAVEWGEEGPRRTRNESCADCFDNVDGCDPTGCRWANLFGKD